MSAIEILSRSRLLIASTSCSYIRPAMNSATVSAIGIPARRISDDDKDDALMKMVEVYVFNLIELRLENGVE